VFTLWLLPIQHGMMLRILPFLAWSHALADEPRAPGPAALVPATPSWIAAGAWMVGAPLFVGAIALGSDPRLGAAALLASSLLQLVTVGGIAARTGLARMRADAIPGMEAR
jgi:hypothetical protein